jgi:hypothetical protein
MLAKGAVLEFDMGPKRSKWGSGYDAAPTSITKGSKVARPLEDMTGAGKGTPSGPQGVDVAGLFDNTSGTAVTFSGATPWVQYQFNAPTEKVTFYTLTSGAAAGDPKSWVLKASADGQKWTTIDQRTDEAFPWRQHTRAFKVAKPGRYAYYRLEVTSHTGAASTSLAEVELLATPPPACVPTAQPCLRRPSTR